MGNPNIIESTSNRPNLHQSDFEEMMLLWPFTSHWTPKIQVWIIDGWNKDQEANVQIWPQHIYTLPQTKDLFTVKIVETFREKISPTSSEPFSRATVMLGAVGLQGITSSPLLLTVCGRGMASKAKSSDSSTIMKHFHTVHSIQSKKQSNFLFDTLVTYF